MNRPMTTIDTTPKILNENTIQIDIYHIPLLQIGCVNNANCIMEYWQKLESSSFPLKSITGLLVACEILREKKELKENPESLTINLLPYPMHIVKMVDLIKCCDAMKGSQKRVNKLKENLCTLRNKAAEKREQQGKIAKEII